MPTLAISDAAEDVTTTTTSNKRQRCRSSIGSSRSSNKNDSEQQQQQQRVILLLDLDCFYAQAACIRLGFQAEHTALALFQWNSVLAVTYPARTLYGIKRGDSWEAVHQKSGGRCYGVHVPILTTATNTATTTTTTETNTAAAEREEAASSAASGQPMSLVEEYNRLYRLTESEQEAARRTELGVRKFSADGKASIECFRIASARIFDAVRRHLDDSFNNNTNSTSAGPTVILERASIDEFFLDVTNAVVDYDNDDETTDNSINTDSTVRTVVIGKMGIPASTEEERGFKREEEEHHGLDEDAQKDDVGGTRWRLQRGCDIAYQIRKAVYDQLGFTMSAGIGTNKTVAKLAASYGKPAGQAVCFPSAVELMLNDTAIRSCRNLGGKLGAAVQSLLPLGVPATVGSIARHLSLPTLQHELKDSATAQWVYDISRGIDREAVESKTQTSAVLTKSITAFKSLNFAPCESSADAPRGGGSVVAAVGHTLKEAARWIQLLAQEVVTRVERDASRNERYPRTCTIQYAAENYTNSNKSIRVPFPTFRLTSEQKVAQLVVAAPKAIRSKQGGDDAAHKSKAIFRLYRVGLCATDFESRAACSNNNAIDSYFAAAAGTTNASALTTTLSANKKEVILECERTVSPTVHRQETSADIGAVVATKQHGNLHNNAAKPPVVAEEMIDPDLELAKKLQATYDREHLVLQVLDKSSKTKAIAQKGRELKSHRIDSFFQKK